MRAFLGMLLVAVSAAIWIQATPAKVEAYKVGQQAADFTLRNIDGTQQSLVKMMGQKGAIVIFTCNTCPYAVMYEDRIIDLHTKYAPLGFPVIAINPNDPEVKEGDDFASMQTRAREKKFPFKYLMDEGQKVYPQFGATRTPHVFLLDSERYVRYIGAIDDNAQNPSEVKVKYVEKAIDALLSGNNPDPSETKSIGCTIKTK